MLNYVVILIELVIIMKYINFKYIILIFSKSLIKIYT